ncbi:MAG TPA: cache domain-containing protein, partial [Devosia sp.]
MPTLKLRGKIVGAAALIFVLAIAASLIFVIQSTQNTAIADADRFLGTMAQTQSKEIQNILETHRAVASSVARTFTSLAQDPSVAPETYKRIFEEQLPDLPHALGIWALINPGQAQAADPDLAIKDLALPGGYFGPSYQRDLSSNTPTFREMNITMEGGLQGWYLDPLAADKPVLNGPYLYDGSLFTSSTDIVRDAQGKGVGLVGVDFNGGVFSELIGTAKPMGTGWVRVINQAG